MGLHIVHPKWLPREPAARTPQPSETRPITAVPTNKTPGSVTVIDDQSLSRAGLLAVLGDRFDLSLVEQVNDPESVASSVSAGGNDIVVINCSLGHSVAFALLKAFLNRANAPSILLVNVPGSVYILEAAIALGVRGAVLESDPPNFIPQAVENLQSGAAFLSPNAAALLLGAMSQKQRRPSLHKLSPRELQILGYVMRGISNKIIGFELFLSIKTVEGHRARILKKLGFKSTAEVVSFALEQGFVPDLLDGEK